MMNKIDWGYWAIVAVLIIGIIMGFMLLWSTGCAILQPKPTPTIIPTPAAQLWQTVVKSNWLVTASILGIAGGIFATLNGQKWGIAIVISCCVSLFMTLAVARFAWWMAVFGLTGSICISIASILSRKQALVEIIKGTQKLKYSIHNIHTDTSNKILESEQSKPTRKIISNIKTKLKLKGEI